ncbi:MAG: hypothetical protein H8E47_12400 [Anaerolineales bacterium]|nr:hypothetical protein [Anaerolineales bacterium]
MKSITRPAGKMYNQAVRDPFTRRWNSAHLLTRGLLTSSGISVTAMSYLLSSLLEF